MRRQHWTVELLDEAIDACADKHAVLSNTEGVDRQRVTRLSQAIAALRADRAKHWHREDRAKRGGGR